jgi:flavodoxin
MRNPNRRAAERRAAEAGGEETLIIYHTKRGSTQEYAEWLQSELGCDVMPYTRGKLGYASMYKRIVFMSWIRGDEVTKLSLLRQNSERFGLNGKKLIIAGVGIAVPCDEYVADIREQNCMGSLSDADLFILPGRFDPEKINVTDKTALSALMSATLHGLPDDAAEETKRRFEQGYDGVSKDALRDIIDAINN